MTEREKFEAWYISEGYNPLYLLYDHDGKDKYHFSWVKNMWIAWQARAELDSSKMEQATA
jgi:hypothetical protein